MKSPEECNAPNGNPTELSPEEMQQVSGGTGEATCPKGKTKSNSSYCTLQSCNYWNASHCDFYDTSIISKKQRVI